MLHVIHWCAALLHAPRRKTYLRNRLNEGATVARGGEPTGDSAVVANLLELLEMYVLQEEEEGRAEAYVVRGVS